MHLPQSGDSYLSYPPYTVVKNNEIQRRRFLDLTQHGNKDNNDLSAGGGGGEMER